MIILDTNVVSEFFRVLPNPLVLQRIEKQCPATCATSGCAATNEPKAIDARAKALFEKFAIFRNPTRLDTYFELPLNGCRDSPHYP